MQQPWAPPPPSIVVSKMDSLPHKQITCCYTFLWWGNLMGSIPGLWLCAAASPPSSNDLLPKYAVPVGCVLLPSPLVLHTRVTPCPPQLFIHS
jgi:hypothetical protein